MKIHVTVAAALLAICPFVLTPAVAHHGDAGRFEESITTLTGTVVALQLVNPHSTIILDVPDETGEMVRWHAELTGVNNLSRMGWTRDTLTAGASITVSGRLIKSGAPYINLTERARVVRMDTCEEIFRSRSDPEGPLPCE